CRRAADAGSAAGDHGGLPIQPVHVMRPLLELYGIRELLASSLVVARRIRTSPRLPSRGLRYASRGFAKDRIVGITDGAAAVERGRVRLVERRTAPEPFD